jgi:hypothetical protein
MLLTYKALRQPAKSSEILRDRFTASDDTQI